MKVGYMVKLKWQKSKYLLLCFSEQYNTTPEQPKSPNVPREQYSVSKKVNNLKHLQR